MDHGQEFVATTKRKFLSLAKFQITFVHKAILELTLHVSIDNWITDSHELDDFIDIKLYRKLKSKWHIDEKRFLARLKYIENL
ncbi:hypothetical protein KA005_50945 [bacterium]|nr:hypothetical protein [bacterium]